MDKREHIIQSAMKLLIEHGAQATPMSAIAKAADTGMGTIYNYFPTKEDLINAIYLYIKQEELAALSVPLADDSVKKQFEHFYRTMIRYMIMHPLHFWFMEQFSASPIIREDTREEGVRVFDAQLAYLRQGQKQGIIKTITIDALIQFVHGGIKGFIRGVLASGKHATTKMIDDQLRISWDAIKE